MSENAGKTGIIYCRVSSKEQVEKTSLESQERICREYASRHGMEIQKVFIDKGESAKTADRPEFIKAVAFCSKAKADFFIVYKLDRFARNQYDHATVRMALKKSGTELRSATEPISEDAVGRVMEGIFAAFAEFDNSIRTERTKRGMEERIRQGVWVWQAPLGYYRPKKGSNIAPDPKIAPLIRLLFEEYAKGVHSYKSLADFLSERGLRTQRGKQPCAQLVEKIIKNPIYSGFIEVWGHKIRGSFESIVSEDLVLQCQKEHRGRARFEARTRLNPSFPLRKTICKACNSSITGSFSTGRKGKKYAYYHHAKQNCSQATFIPKEVFEQNFIAYLDEITPNPRYEKIFKAVIRDVWQENYKKLDENNRIIRMELDKLETERQKIFDLHRSGAYTDDEFIEQKDVVNQKIFQKHKLIQDGLVEVFDMEEILDHCFKFVRSTSATWLRLSATPELQRRFQNLIFPSKVVFDGEKFGTSETACIYRLNQEYQGKKSNLVALVGQNWNQILSELNQWQILGNQLESPIK